MGCRGFFVNVAFAVSLIEPIVLGFALVRRHEFRVPAILLIVPVVVLPLTFVPKPSLSSLTRAIPRWGVNLGLALLCIAVHHCATSMHRPGRTACSEHGVGVSAPRPVR